MTRQKSIRSRVYEVMQYEINPVTGESLGMNEDTIKRGLALKEAQLDNWAYVRHDKDVYNDNDDLHEGKQVGDKRPAHWHIILKFKNQIEISSVAKAFNVPEQYVEKKVGAGAFYDCVYYLTHEDEKQQALGKHVYERDEIRLRNKVTADAIWETIDIREERRMKKLPKSEAVERYVDRLSKGKATLREIYEADNIVYAENEVLFKRARKIYLKNAPVPPLRNNYFISGRGGAGKTVIAKAMARSLYPELSDEECYFVVGDGRVAFDNYDGQPVIIWDDFRAKGILGKFDRGTVWKIFAVNPDRVSMHVKNGEVTLINTVNIVTSVETFHEFMETLAGEYKDSNRVVHKSEDPRQGYRRFPVFVEVTENQFEMFISMGLTDGEIEDYRRIITTNLNTIEFAKNQSLENNQKVFGTFNKVHEKIRKLKSSEENEVKDVEFKEVIDADFIDFVENEKDGD